MAFPCLNTNLSFLTSKPLVHEKKEQCPIAGLGHLLYRCWTPKPSVYYSIFYHRVWNKIFVLGNYRPKKHCWGERSDFLQLLHFLPVSLFIQDRWYLCDFSLPLCKLFYLWMSCFEMYIFIVRM